MMFDVNVIAVGACRKPRPSSQTRASSLQVKRLALILSRRENKFGLRCRNTGNIFQQIRHLAKVRLGAAVKSRLTWEALGEGNGFSSFVTRDRLLALHRSGIRYVGFFKMQHSKVIQMSNFI